MDPGRLPSASLEEIGTLTPGRHADLIVVDRDPLSCPVEEIGDTVVETTLLAGRPVQGELPG